MDSAFIDGYETAKADLLPQIHELEEDIEDLVYACELAVGALGYSNEHISNMLLKAIRKYKR